MRSLLKIVVIAFCVALLMQAKAAIVLSTNLPLLSSQPFYCQHGDSPDDDSVQPLNPPVFKWIYNGDNPWAYATDRFPRTFTFQLSTNSGGTFSSLYWNITGGHDNFYNLLPAITNADGSAWLGTNYWRVIYYNSNATAILATSVVHHFTLTPTATNWDRSMLADSNYLYSVLSPNPHMAFWATNRAPVASFVKGTFNPGGQGWISISNDAVQAVTNSWWNNESVFTNLAQNVALSHAAEIWEVAFVYQLTTNAFLASSNPETMLDIYDRYYMAQGADRLPPYGGTDAAADKSWAVAIDYLYPLMNSTQQSNAIYALEKSVQFYFNEDWWYPESPADTSRVYAYNQRLMGSGGAAKEGDSHQRFDAGVGLTMCMVGWAHSTNLQQMFPYFLDYFIAEKDCGYGDEGRGYNVGDNTPIYRNFGSDILSILAFRAAKLEINPVFNIVANQFTYMEPLGYRGLCEPWGDLAYDYGGSVRMGYNSGNYFWDLAYLTGNGAMMQQFTRQNPTHFQEGGGSPMYDGLVPYYFSAPTPADWATNVYLDTGKGYVVVNSLQPNDYGAFSNSVGFVTQARPDTQVNHAMWSDGSVQMWAYGAQVTAGGMGGYGRHPMIHSGAVMVDGVGIAMTRGDPMEPWYSRFTAFTNSADFAFVQSDTTKAYNRSNFITFGASSDLISPFYDTNKVPYLSSMVRNIVFPHHKYLVLYDSMTTTTNAHFQWVWHYMEPTGVINSNGCSFSYTSTNFFGAGNVTVYVVPFIDPTTMRLTSLPGTNNYLNNPVTGESYSFNTGFEPFEPLPNGSIWIQNATASRTNHFGFVVYPVRPGGSAPTITRISDTSVRVQQSADDDTISIDNSTGLWTLDLSGGSPATSTIHHLRARTPRIGG